MACLDGLSPWKLLPRWVKSFFQRDSAYSDTSSYIDTFSSGGEVRLEIPDPEPSYTSSTRPLSSDSNSSIIRLPTPPPLCVPYRRIQPMPSSYEALNREPTPESEDREFKGWSKFFLDNSKWLMQQYLWLLLTMNKKVIMKQKNHGCPILNRNLYRRIKSFENYCGVIYSPGSEAFIMLHVLYHDETTGRVRCSAAYFDEEPQSSVRLDLGFLIHAKEWRDLKKHGFTWRCWYSLLLSGLYIYA